MCVLSPGSPYATALTAIDSLASLGAAGLMGAMWLSERNNSRVREEHPEGTTIELHGLDDLTGAVTVLPLSAAELEAAVATIATALETGGWQQYRERRSVVT